MTTFDLDKHTWRLLQNEPFFAALSRRIHKTATTAIPFNNNSGRKDASSDWAKLPRIWQHFPNECNTDAATATGQILKVIKAKKIKLDTKKWTNLFIKNRKKKV